MVHRPVHPGMGIHDHLHRRVPASPGGGQAPAALRGAHLGHHRPAVDPARLPVVVHPRRAEPAGGARAAHPARVPHPQADPLHRGKRRADDVAVAQPAQGAGVPVHGDHHHHHRWRADVPCTGRW
ncbi:hypothetical protein G6F59_017976 [Rhizopus arrhizus]|nr:hypothetical protein G6F59_017976 [Rhizopus arrhizus]